MAQLDNKFSAFWMDTTTAPWTPLTSLSATITIREADSPYTVVVNDEAMTNMWGGHYIYVFSGMSLEKEYVYICNPNATAYIESGVTQNNLYKWIQDNRSGWGGGFSVDLSPISRGIGNLSKLVTDESKLIKEHVTKENSETNSHIDLAKDETISKIDSIEIPETVLEEKEAKKAIKLIQGVDKKLSSYIESEMKEKDEINQITAEFTKQEIEDRKQEKLRMEEERKMEEEKKRKEEEEQKKEEELMKAIEEEVKDEFEKQDEMEKEEKKKELEAEIKEMEREMKEKERELKSL